MLVLTSITKLQSALGTTQHIRVFDLGDKLLLVDGSSLFMVQRSGALDTSFSGDGVAFLAGANINGYNAVKSGDTIVVSGLQMPSIADPRTFSYVSITSNGAGAEAAAATPVLTGLALPNATVPLSDGSLLLMGMTMTRVSATLGAQSSYSAALTEATSLLGQNLQDLSAGRGTQLYGATLGPDGKLYLFGSRQIPADLGANEPATNLPALFRFNTDGTLDPSFTMSLADKLSSFQGQSIDQVEFDAQGRLYVNGVTGLFRLSSTGALDTSFGTNGLLLPKDLDPTREDLISSFKIDGQRIYLVNATTYGEEHLLVADLAGHFLNEQVDSPFTAVRYIWGELVYASNNTLQWLQPSVSVPEIYTVKSFDSTKVYAATEDTKLSGFLPGGDDAATASLTYSFAQQPAHGAVTVRSDGTFDYVPGTNYFGTDTIRFNLLDAAGDVQNVEVKVQVTAVVDTLRGSAARDTLVGNPDADVLMGLAGNDSLQGGGGDDTIDGGDGVDTAVYSTTRSATSLQRQGTTLKIDAGQDGSDTVSNVERFRFADQSVAFDLDGSAGTVAKIIGALLGKAYLQDKGIVGLGLSLIDGGMTYQQAVNLVVAEPVFAQLAGASAGGAVSNAQFVDFVYRNVTGSAADSATRAELVGLLDNGLFTQESLAMLACEHAWTAATIDLTGLAVTGLAFIQGQ